MTSIGDINSATYAQSVDGIGPMLDLLPDNLDNLITARNVRDVVYTLYEEILAASASQFFYSNPKQIEVPLGNWTKPPNARGWGGTFSNVSLQEMFDNIFYKDSTGSATLAFKPSLTTKIEYKGANSAAYIDRIRTTRGVSLPEATTLAGSGFDEITGNFGFSWTATRGTYELVDPGRIFRDQSVDLELYSVPVAPNGGNGDVAQTTKLILNVPNSYYFAFKDSKNQSITSNSVSVSYGDRQYIGVTPVNTLPTDEDIRKLALSPSSSPDINNNGFSNSGSFNSLKGEISGHGGDGKYLILVTTEKLNFTILDATAFFYKEYLNVDYTNIFGYTTKYNIYISIEPYTTPTQKYKII